MRKTMAAAAAAGFLLAGLGTAGPALAVAGDTQLCSPADNGGTLVNGVCVLPAVHFLQAGGEVLLNSGGGVDVWTVVSGGLPPGMFLQPTFGAGATLIGGTPTAEGTFTFTVDNVPFDQPGGTPSQLTYSITVGPPIPVKVVLPTTGARLYPADVGVPYAQNFFRPGGVGPYHWQLVDGRLPPGLALVTTTPDDTSNQLAGTPAHPGTFRFTMRVSDAIGGHASHQFSLNIKN